jgi:hypothetical protein
VTNKREQNFGAEYIINEFIMIFVCDKVKTLFPF